MEIVPRRLDRRVAYLLAHFPAVVVTGARQVGKSTLARIVSQMYPCIVYDLEQSADRHELGDNPGDVLRKHSNKLVIIDEVQKMPGLFVELRSVIDEERVKGNSVGKFLLLGSASGSLLRQTGESLAGRVARVRLHGLDWLEVAPEGNLDRLWSRGGYPNSYFAVSSTASADWLRSYAQDILTREVPAMGLRLDTDQLYKMLVLLCNRQGSTTAKTDLGNDIDSGRATSARYLDVLEQLMLLRRLPPYSTNLRKRIVKHPKYYICDSGLLHALCGVSPLGSDNPMQPRLIGASWEGFVIENIIAVLPRLWRASFYRDHKGNEVDLVLEKPGSRPWAVEIKRNKASYLSKGGKRAMSALQPERAFLVHKDPGHRSLGSNIESMGLETFMHELLAQGGEGVSAADRARATFTSPNCADLIYALKEGKPKAPMLRQEFIQASLQKAEDIVGECTGVADSNFRLGWLQVRDDLMRWLSAESTIVLEDTPSSSYIKDLRILLEGLLNLKESYEGNSSNRAQYSASCLSAYDIFVHVIGVLMQSEKFEVVHYFLSRIYDGVHPSRAFGCPHLLPQDESQDLLQKLLLDSKMLKPLRLLEAEVIMMLFDIIAFCNGTYANVQLWPLLMERKYLKPRFMRWAQSPEGRGFLQACLGASAETIAELSECVQKALDSSSLDEAYKSNVWSCLENIGFPRRTA